MSDQQAGNSPPSKHARQSRTLTGALLLSFAFAVIVFYWLLHSPSGLHWIAATVNRWNGDTIQLTGVHGTLQDLHIENIHFKSAELALTLHDLHLDWNPAQLLNRRISINQLALAAIHIEQQSVETGSSSPSPPESLQLPVGLTIATLIVDSIYLNPAAQENAVPLISALTLTLDSDGQHHRLTQLDFTTPWSAIRSHMELAGSAPFALSAQATLTAAGSWGDIEAAVTGNLQQLTIQAASKPPAPRMELQAQLQPFAANPVTHLNVTVAQWNPADFLAAAPQAKLSLSAQLAQNEAEQLAGSISIENHAAAPLDRNGVPVSAIRTHVSITPESLVLPDFHTQLGKNGTVRGELAWDRSQHVFTANLAVEKLDPRQIDSRLQTAVVSGKVEFSGTTQTQSARIDLRDRSLRLTADITRSGDQVELAQFNLQRNQSRLTGQGRLRLTEEQSFELSGQLIRFNSADFIQTVDSDLNATLQLSGHLTPEVTGTLKYAIEKSRLAKSPVSGSGEIAFAGLEHLSGKAELLAGSNRLLAHGRMEGSQHDVQLTVNAPALAQLGLGLSGDLQTQLTFRGSSDVPQLDWKLTSRQLSLPGKQQLSGVSASAQWHKDAVALNIAADTVQAHEQATIKQFTAVLDGKTGHHHLLVKADLNREVAFRLAANGGLNRVKSGQPLRWQGQLTELSTTGDMPVHLLAPAPLAASAASVSLEQMGISVSSGSIRVEQLHWTPQSWNTRGDFSGIAVLPGTPERMKDNPLQLGGRWHFDSAAHLTGELHIQRERGDWYLPGDLPQPLGLQQLQLQATAAHGKLSGQFEFASQLLGTATAAVTLPLQHTQSRWGISQESPLQGNIRAAITSLKLLNPLLGSNLRSDGELRIEAGIRGTLQQPDIGGKLSGTGLSLVLLEQGIHLQQGTLDAHFQQTDLHIDRLHFTSLHAPPPDSRLFGNLALKDTSGSLTITGKAGLTGDPSQLDFTIDRLPLARKTDYWIVASGTGATRWEKDHLSITGDLRTDAGLIMQPPEGRPELPDDVVLVNAPTSQRSRKVPLHLDMALDLGEKFYIRASGLEGRLTGKLQMRNDNNQQLKLTGTIAAQDAAFKAYGQNLTVKRGIVSFQGPLDDPNLNVLAVREGLAVEAGVEIAGSVRHPRVKLVSTPDVPDTEKLSWIVLGRKPDASGLDTSVLLSAAGSILGGQSGSGVTDKITQALGVDEITFKQASVGSSLTGQIGVIGKRISSRAYLSYERSLTATTMGITKLTYNLTPKITVVTQAGEDSAADLFYTIQFD
ncbi:MAG: translocation/assembly module TamB domain-containing protein [Proteobacteria bacterium]|nr:translocation/assembly module TamB domain-containing protein [Pseudomonadota bacterium]